MIPEAIKSNGFRLSDMMVIKPMSGRKRTVKVQRTKIKLTLKNQFETQWGGDYLDLPSAGRSCEAKMFWHGPMKKCEEGRFLIRCEGANFVKLNGVWTREAWVSRGDQLIIGYNELSFEKEAEQKVNLYQSEIDKIGKAVIHSNLSILLEGETGVGKSTLAREIHHQSGRRGEFIQLNLGALNRNLIESELFGHKKGSFTGAIQDKLGSFEQANNGTIFLDEIDSLSLDLQVKLLLFLDNQSFRPVGSQVEKKVDVRIIFASGRSLLSLVERGEFRKDLFYRLSSQMCLKIKSLKEDMKKKKLALDYFCDAHGTTLEASLEKFYLDFSWPGNLRQMKGHLERKVLQEKNASFLKIDHLDELLLNNILVDRFEESIKTIDEIKRDHARKVFQSFEGHIGKASHALGISKNTLKVLVKPKERRLDDLAS